MDCPVCQVQMVVFEFRGIELDYCADCMGVWFDAGEIELLFRSLGVDADTLDLEFIPPTRRVSEARRRCPICGTLMEKVSPPGRDVILDRCRRGDGIWFDAGEIRAALSETGWDSGESPVDDALASYFKYALSPTDFEEK